MYSLSYSLKTLIYYKTLFQRARVCLYSGFKV